MFLLTLTFGIAAVVAVALAPLYVGRLPVAPAPRLGAALVTSSALLALVAVVHPRHPDGRLVFLGAFALLLAGALLVLADEGDDGDDDVGEPPWWPEFESDFRRYAARPRRPLARA